jgi:5'-3' exonuclease
MGIPSYYKKLCDRVPGLLSKVRNGQQPTHLWIDFNCMVYHCLRRPGARPYVGEDTRIEWENWLIQDVCKYLKKVVSLVNPSKQVFVGVDGVVPMAKMRQQRLRRFKSHWTAAEEIRIGKSEAKPRWDTNAITPGTAFMERLGDALRACTSSGLTWIVSTADEPGEGEHKAMAGIRGCVELDSHVVYGLDADLIILSLLQRVNQMWLFREAIECGDIQYNAFNEEEYRYFSIHKLKEHITKGQDGFYLLDYCMAMSFMGNDFLPHGLSLKLKDGGHDLLLEMLHEVRKRHSALILNGHTYYWNIAALQDCIKWLADREEGWVQKHCSAKVGQRFQPARGSSPLEVTVDEWNKTPLRACEELALVQSIQTSVDRKTSVSLRDDWKEVYHERWLHTANTNPIVHQYLTGLNWIVQYYTGEPINKEWCYPWFLPPLWSDMAEYLTANTVPYAPEPSGVTVKPQEQLALVLPLASFWLIRDSKLRMLPKKAPHLWPFKFELFTAGHKMMWECEAQIPLFTPERLRYFMS